MAFLISKKESWLRVFYYRMNKTTELTAILNKRLQRLAANALKPSDESTTKAKNSYDITV
ncbi:hypothetical protein C9J01_21610 [Photobacterium rosenbergii]|uniref:Uncharacterized protein n=1 Tax=Photobacterium rosenbergii TaxID=294936 RepID=A0A2T3N886_9GAMM|nr:hypothetical protein C9J01_21610 [Photobacterium rosenbergii]